MNNVNTYLNLIFLFTEFCLTSTDQAESILSGNVGQGIGKPCIFPFYFNNVEYDSCTDRDHSTFWCPTKVDDLGNYIDNEWANCGQNCQNSKYYFKNYSFITSQIANY